MTRITNTEQILLLLRAQLQRAAAARKRKTGNVGRTASRSALKRVQDIASTEGMSEAAIERALVAGLLTEEFGADVANDAGFQAMVDEVVGMIRRDEAGGVLLKKAVGQLGVR